MDDNISPRILDFLRLLQQNNNRVWFEENKPMYEAARRDMIHFADALLAEMNKHDVIETASGKQSLKRIYRDIRFSKDKTPYKTHFGGGFKRATAARRGGYYFHIQPDNTFIAGGFWRPERDDLKRIRAEIDQDANRFRAVLKDAGFKKTFGQLEGEQLKTAPKGYARDHADIDLLCYKQFLFKKSYTEKQIVHRGFAKRIASDFAAARPFLNYMSEVLTTNLNGESLL